MRASRFFATLNWAPASRIFRRSSVDCATESPRLRVTTTTLVSVKTSFSSATRSAFCERSMPTPNIRPGLLPNELQQSLGKSAQALVSVGLGIWRCGMQRTTKRRTASNDSCPRLGCKLRGEPQQLSRTVLRANQKRSGAYSEIGSAIKSLGQNKPGRSAWLRPGNVERFGTYRPRSPRSTGGGGGGGGAGQVLVARITDP